MGKKSTKAVLEITNAGTNAQISVTKFPSVMVRVTYGKSRTCINLYW